MELKRRDFLRAVSCTLAALGVSEAELILLGKRYYQALAESSPRKLALLIGINQYLQEPALAGCITDVELQRELLIHRFGFHPTDILTLTDQKASRQQIETAFLKHLIEQVQPGDVVFFHFSGYGRRIQLNSPEMLLNSLVPSDGVVPTSAAPVVNDLLEETLWLLLRSLATERVTTVLDTSYNASSTGLQGNLRIRARPQVAQGQLSTQVQVLQSQLLSRQNNIVFNQRLPGVVLTASRSSQLATEAQWSGFSAGLFTYALTQYLWEATPATTVQVSLSRISAVVEQLNEKQQPVLSSQNQEQLLLAAHLMLNSSAGADGVVIAADSDGKTGELWLAGLPPQVLEYYGVNSRLSVVTPPLQLQLRSRTGLTAKAQISGDTGTGSLQIGQLVQEAVRVLPHNISLSVALDATLERIERVDATSAFAAIPRVSSVKAGEQPSDYLFARVREAKTQDLLALSSSRYGLFSLGQELIPKTAGEAGEAVKVAVQRLVPQLQTLLAAKLWRLTINEASSHLGVRATLEIITAPEQVLMQRGTRWQSNPQLLLEAAPKNKMLGTSVELAPGQIAAQGNIPTVAIGSRIQYKVYNDSDRPVYLIMLGLDSSKSAIVLYPTQPNSENNGSEKKPVLKDLVIAPGETITVPKPLAFEWVIQGPTGLAETYLIFSCAPFSQTRMALETVMHPIGDAQRVAELRNPMEVAQAVLQDLHQASSVRTDIIGSATDTYALDVNAWASLSFIYQVV